VGSETSDDACVYRLSDSLALVMTVDFFTPVVDDPYVFGQIAAANALSDVYAMGGTPLTAMNLLCFPSCLELSVAGEILRGGAEKAAEANCVIAGGHSIADDEPKYGLSVTGVVDPARVLKNSGARPGDKLLLTKALGTGVVMTALKASVLTGDEAAEAIRSMGALNRRAAEIAANYHAHACTDITGFGLIGHVCELAEGSGVTVTLRASAASLLPHALDMALEDMFPGGMERNHDYFGSRVSVDSGVSEALTGLLYDPQTSGGLLFSVPAEEADDLLAALKKEIPVAAEVGEVAEKVTFPVRVVK